MSVGWRASVFGLMAAGAALVGGQALASGRGAADPRLQLRPYDPQQVVRLNGRVNVQASILFEEGERIENVAIGDANLWQVTPSKRAGMLFVKPLGLRARTNMTVVTDRRTYLFDLVAGSGGVPVYLLRFSYPPMLRETKEIVPESPAPDLSPEAQALAQAAGLAQLEAGKARPAPARPNFAWKQTGSAQLFPQRLYDLAGSTYLAWPPARPIPAILTRDAKGVEGPVNYAVQGGEIVMDTVPAQIILRLGKARAVLQREPVGDAASGAGSGAGSATSATANPQSGEGN